MPDSEKLLSLGQVADLVGVSDMTIRRHIRAGRLSALLIGGRYRIRPSAVAEYLDEFAVKRQPPAQ